MVHRHNEVHPPCMNGTFVPLLTLHTTWCGPEIERRLRTLDRERYGDGEVIERTILPRLDFLSSSCDSC